MEKVLKTRGVARSGRIPKLSMQELVSVVNQRYEKSLLRRQIVPQGFCYVCSRIDPGGLFRRPNSYMFRKGFFTACEHFPKAPYTTFIEENGEDDVIIDQALVETATENGKRTAAPSISVQIRRSSNLDKFTPSERLGQGSSTDRYGRESSRDQLSVSSPGKFGRVSSRDTGRRSLAQETRIEKQSRESKRNERLPQITQRGVDVGNSNRTSPLKSQKQPFLLTRESTETSIELNRLNAISSKQTSENDKNRELETESKFASSKSESSHVEGVRPSGSIHLPDVHISQTVPSIHKSESVKSEHSGVTGLSTFSKGQTTLSSSTDVTSQKEEIEKPSADTRLEKYHRPIINEDDGLDHSAFPAYPVTDNLYGMNIKVGVSKKGRPVAGRKREPVVKADIHIPDPNEVTDERPGSGHLRYHHRGEDDTVPYPGFEIPPTPTAEELAEMERIENEKIIQELEEEEKRHMEKMVAEGKVFDVDRSSKPLTDEDSVSLSENISMTIRSLSGKRSFCRCPTDIRILASSQVCKHCGKAIDRYSLKGEHKSRNGLDSEFPFSRSMGMTSRNSREKMLNDRKLNQRVHTRTVSDEDYMDLESIIQDDDARYWTSDDELEGTSHATTTSSLRRLRNAKPYPLVNPDLHKEVYLRALNEVQYREINKNNETRFDGFKKLRRPHVFSYYQLWPFAGKCEGCGNDLGIRPDNSFPDKKPKQGQLMKHIFGDVKVEDYYPGGSKSSEPRIILDSYKIDDRSMTKSMEASVINSSRKIKRSGILFAE